ncbi:hypothetical protein M413DRAFT_27492 [Hebeloma cylindrosporum]|uniref:Uncharacterized protein n=1 Tax=Hebeloma cylindrosporum TaxID=76867 RepID=A0A0C2XWA4_HEBCY|nr:hypothetical protein M413DRAFT_27492 [Hebeloma cylindrosporum h7]
MSTTPLHNSRDNKAPKSDHSAKPLPLNFTSCSQYHESARTTKKKTMDFIDLCGHYGANRMGAALHSLFYYSLSRTWFSQTLPSPVTIVTFVDQSIARDGQSDADSLPSWDLHLHRAQPAQAATLFVDSLLRPIETIKFMRTSQSASSNQSTSSSSFDHNGCPDARKQVETNLEELRQPFLSKHSYLTKSRNTFLTVYEHASLSSPGS